MIITLSTENKQKLKYLFLNLFRTKKLSIRYLGNVIGTIISDMPAGVPGTFFYRYLEHNKVNFLQINKGNFNDRAKIIHEGKQELTWWLDNIDSIEKPIALYPIDLEYFYDSLPYSWDSNFGSNGMGGVWNIK